MKNNIGKVSRKGMGECGNPFCTKKKAPDSFLCKKHAREMAELAEEAAKDPKLMVNQRSDNPNRQAFDVKAKKRRAPRVPTCCTAGCYQPRVPGEPFCDGCEAEAVYDLD